MGIEFDPSTASLKFQSKVDPRWCQDGPFSCFASPSPFSSESLSLFLRIRPHRIRPILPIPRVPPEIQLQILPEIKSHIYIQQQHLKEAMATGEVKLLGTWSSPFVLRIKWTLRMKGVQYEFIEEDLSNKSPMLLQYNPVYKKVPILIHDGKPITESLVILEYIDEMWKDNPILPKNPYEKSMARFLSNFGDCKCLPSIWQICISTGEKQQEAITSAAGNLNILEEKLEGKKFFGGETIGYADISLGWISYMVSLLDDVTNVKLIDEVTYPLLSQWISNFTSSPLVKDSLPPRDRMVSKFRMLREAFLASAATA